MTSDTAWSEQLRVGQRAGHQRALAERGPRTPRLDDGDLRDVVRAIRFRAWRTLAPGASETRAAARRAVAAIRVEALTRSDSRSWFSASSCRRKSSRGSARRCREDRHHHGLGIVHAARDVERDLDVHAGRSAVTALLAREAARDLEGLRVGDEHPLVDDVEVERGRDSCRRRSPPPCRGTLRPCVRWAYSV